MQGRKIQRTSTPPPGLLYFPDFISEDEEREFIRCSCRAAAQLGSYEIDAQFDDFQNRARHIQGGISGIGLKLSSHRISLCGSSQAP